MRRSLVLAVAFLMLLALMVPVGAQEATNDRALDRTLPDSVLDLKLDTPIMVTDGIGLGVLDPSLAQAEGLQRVVVRLKGASLAEAGLTSDSAQSRHVRNLNSDQDAFVSRNGVNELGRVQRVLNAVFVEVDASALAALAADPDVARIAPVGNYEMDLSETVPYTGAAAVQAGGVDGSGIKVAVLDSGIDYTHLALGGSGDTAEYLANDPTIIEPGTFPTAKVVGGYDFVGSDWPTFGPEAPDPDPLDDGRQAGHGSHVAHIIGGNVTDVASNIYPGMAPGVDLYAVKVCSSVSTSCSGIALIQGMDFAVDPNMDGKSKDRVDVVNMSLGSSYGQPFDDDLSAAVDGATALGVLTVASAGNSADKPYITGSPAASPTALSVAQTQVPSAALQLITVDGVDYPAVFQPWSTPLGAAIIAPVQYGDGAGGNLNGCAPFDPGTFAGKIGLVDRGACNFTLKIKNIGDAGGLAGIIGLVAPGAPFSGGDGGDRPIDIPGYMIGQAESNAIKAQIGNPGIGTIDPDNQLPLMGQMVGSSSRGPSNNYQAIKPEIGAPGASISAIAGSGTGTGPFGGTSGAAPMVTGAAALVLDAFGGTKTSGQGTPGGQAIGHGLDPLTVKALLMNNGETNIDTDPFTGLAPITRIGGGELRVDDATAAGVAAFVKDDYTGALGFGYVDVPGTVTLTKTVTLVNLDNQRHTYDVTPTFRYASDETGAVTVNAPSSITVKPGLGKETTFEVSITIDGSLLPGNYMNSGSMGANPDALTLNEFDGYLMFDDGSHPIHMAWQVLPRKAAQVVPDTTEIVPGSFPQVIGLDNTGVGTAQNDVYALLATSPDLPEGERGAQSPTPDIRAVGINTYPVPAGFCSAEASFLWAFAIDTWEPQSHLLPVRNYIFLDIDQNGVDDYRVFNSDLGGFTSISDGRQVSYAQNLDTGSASAFFFTEHATNTGNTVHIICAEQIGLTGADILATNVDMSVFSHDFYFGGPGDTVEGLTVTPLGEQFYGVASDVPGLTYDAAGLAIYDFGPFPGNSQELGLMMFTNGDRGSGARGGATMETETILFTTP